MTDTILIVEDDLDLRQDLAFLIENQGHEVTTAANGREALEKLAANGRPCMILLDLMMPVMDGWQLRSELLKDPKLRDVPVVLLSGIADIQDEVRSLKAEDYVTKPIDLEKLYRLVAQYC
jgi:CheY-like chemotaxis protein